MDYCKSVFINLVYPSIKRKHSRLGHFSFTLYPPPTPHPRKTEEELWNLVTTAKKKNLADNGVAASSPVRSCFPVSVLAAILCAAFSVLVQNHHVICINCDFLVNFAFWAYHMGRKESLLKQFDFWKLENNQNARYRLNDMASKGCAVVLQ